MTARNLRLNGVAESEGQVGVGSRGEAVLHPAEHGEVQTPEQVTEAHRQPSSKAVRRVPLRVTTLFGIVKADESFARHPERNARKRPRCGPVAGAGGDGGERLRGRGGG